jgi:hypothetical protein
MTPRSTTPLYRLLPEAPGLLPDLSDRGRRGILALILISLVMVVLELSSSAPHASRLALLQGGRAAVLAVLLLFFVFGARRRHHAILLLVATLVFSIVTALVGGLMLDWDSHTLMVCAFAVGAGTLILRQMGAQRLF